MVVLCCVGRQQGGVRDRTGGGEVYVGERVCSGERRRYVGSKAGRTRVPRTALQTPDRSQSL